MTNWRDLAGGAPATVPAPPSTGTPAPTPNWRDLGQQAAEAGGPPAPQPRSPGTATADTGDGQEAWEQAQQLGATPLTPQPTAPSPAPPADPADAGAAVGMRIAASGATATDVDPDALLRMIQTLQAQVTQLTASQAQAGAPDVVKYATAYADHLQAKADAHPVINADPDHTFIPALQHAAQLVNAAEQAAASGSGHEGLISLAKDAGAWVAAHARRFPALDYDYLGQLAEEVASAAAKLLA